MSPLVRWVTKRNREAQSAFHPVAALELQSASVPPGTYCYRVERWRFKGLVDREHLGYAARSLDAAGGLEAALAEGLLQQTVRQARTWDYPDCSLERVAEVGSEVERAMEVAFAEAVTRFGNENVTAHQIRTERVKAVFDRRIGQDEQRLRTLREAGRSERIIRLTEARLRTAREAREARLADLDRRATGDFERETVAAGVVRVGAIGALS
jgi:hypothetical protein